MVTSRQKEHGRRKSKGKALHFMAARKEDRKKEKERVRGREMERQRQRQ